MRTIAEGKTAKKAQAAVLGQAAAQRKETTSWRKIKSRFGELQINPAKAMSFQHGILGVPGSISFCLADLPNLETDQFKLLQCVEDESLCFIVVPSQFDNQLLEKKDLDEACTILAIEPSNLLVFFIVSVHAESEVRRLSVNAKAPILVDAAHRSGTQYVFQNPNYKIQHMIS